MIRMTDRAFARGLGILVVVGVTLLGLRTHTFVSSLSQEEFAEFRYYIMWIYGSGAAFFGLVAMFFWRLWTLQPKNS